MLAEVRTILSHDLMADFLKRFRVTRHALIVTCTAMRIIAAR